MFLFSLDKNPEVELLHHMGVLFLILGTLFSLGFCLLFFLCFLLQEKLLFYLEKETMNFVSVLKNKYICIKIHLRGHLPPPLRKQSGEGREEKVS